jgi:hypothetical protein
MVITVFIKDVGKVNHRTRYFEDCNCKNCSLERRLREPYSGNPKPLFISETEK